MKMKKIEIKPDIWIKMWGNILVLPHIIAKRAYESGYIIPIDSKVPGGEVKLTEKGEDAMREGVKILTP